MTIAILNEVWQKTSSVWVIEFTKDLVKSCEREITLSFDKKISPLTSSCNVQCYVSFILHTTWSVHGINMIFFFFKVAMTNRFVIFVLRALQYHVVVVDHLRKKAHCLLSNVISTLLESQGNSDLFLRVLKKNWTHENGKQNKYNRLAQAPIPPFFRAPVFPLVFINPFSPKTYIE